MQVHPRESRKAHPQTGRPFSAAASSLTQPQDSPAEDIAICAAPQPTAGDDGATVGQTFATAARPARHVPPIPPRILRQIFNDDLAFNRRDEANDATWSQIGVSTLAAVAFVLFLYFLDGGWIK